VSVLLLNNSLLASVAFLLAILAAALSVRFRSLQQRALWGVVFLAVILGFAKPVSPVLPVIGFYGGAVLALGIAVWSRLDRRSDVQRWLARASHNPIVLLPPFAGRWRVAAGGPDPRTNHHQIVTDQYFAYDFLCDEGESWDRPILAPCDGLIAYIEDRHDDAPPDESHRDHTHPAGNYISIETHGGYVILAHLKRGSTEVKSGVPVRAGDVLARCGNSGNARGAHLHIHAQGTPYVEVNIAKGLPIAFKASVDAEPLLLEYGDRLDRQA
jgi:hypothetical protein